VDSSGIIISGAVAFEKLRPRIDCTGDKVAGLLLVTGGGGEPELVNTAILEGTAELGGVLCGELCGEETGDALLSTDALDTARGRAGDPER
jgi:hypothetical protein